MPDKYILVLWPESQLLMEEEWFDECVLINGENQINEFGDAAYLVPEERYNSMPWE